MEKRTEYNLLIRKLDEFIRKYYKNQLLKGSLLSVGFVLVGYLLVTVLEYYGHFNSAVRTVLFYTFILFSLGVFGRWVLLPLFKLFRLGKVISHEQAARIIGSHFPNVEDKLLNTLQLQKQAQENEGPSASLIRASIDQRIEDLRPIPFKAAIDLTSNRRYLKYAVPPLLIFLILVFSAPTIIRDGTQRIVNHTQYFEEKAPFTFKVMNKDLNVVERKDFELQVKVEGDQLPNKAYIELNGNRFRMNKMNAATFTHEFKNVGSDKTFRIHAAGFDTRPYTLKTLPEPRLIEFKISATPPEYTGMSKVERNNAGDLVVPEGTRIQWDLRTAKTEKLEFTLGDSTYSLDAWSKDRYRFNKRVFSSKPYRIAPLNKFVQEQEPVEYHIKVERDQFPNIQVEEREDSLTSKRRFFRGKVEDDHGFSKLTFNYRFVRTGSDSARKIPEGVQIRELSISPGKTKDEFFHSWSLAELGIKAGDQVEYYFKVWDNDRINGPKASRSRNMVYKAPSLSELSKENEEKNKKIKEDLKEGIEMAKEIQKDVKDLKKDVLNKKKVGWQEKQKIKDLLEKQKKLREKVEGIKKQDKENNRRQSEFKEMDEEILEKQKKLQDLFDKIMDEEMKKKLEELQKLMDKMNQEDLQKELEEMEMDNEQFEKELDRSLEMFKQLEFEQKLNETIKKLDRMEKKQKELSKKSEKSGKKDPKELQEEQDSLNKEFEGLKKELDSLRKKDQDLEQSHGMEDTKPQEQDIQQQMQKSSQELQEGKNKKASDSQKKASDEMKKLSQKLQSMQMQMQSQQMKMNMEGLRALLENLIQLSFDQENLMEKLQNTNTNDPEYVKLTEEQKRIRDNTQKVKDSLYSLSKKVFQLKATINSEIEEIDRNMKRSIDLMADRKPRKASSRQQYVMTSMNDLALLLDEALQQMQKQMAMKMPGKGNCQKPGGKGSKPSISQMRQLQKQLNKRMEQMKEQMKKGGKKPGGKGGQKMSKELAKMAAKQAAIRKKLEELSRKLNEGGKGAGNELKRIAEQMEETEEDLVNRKLDEETLKRQKDIEIRLLKSEKAERERGYEKKRKAEQAKEQEYSNPKEFFEYKRKKEQEVELLKTVPPSLRSYYKKKVDRYFDRYQDQAQ